MTLEKINELIDGIDVYGVSPQRLVPLHIKDNTQTAYQYLTVKLLAEVLEELKKLNTKEENVEVKATTKKATKETETK